MDISSLFKRPEQNYKVIDGIRALAIIWVLILHVWFFHLSLMEETSALVVDNFWLSWIARGDLGVDLFFVISGFLIGTILFKEFKRSTKINFKRFYIRRFLRLIPAYTFAMLLGIFFLRSSGLDNWQDSWSNFLYVNNYITGSYMPWTWSLAIEEQFYIVTPFLIAFVLPLFKRKYVFFGILAIIPIAFTYHYSVNIFGFSIPFKGAYPNEDWLNWFWNYYMLTHLRYGGLLAGVVAAYLNVFYMEQVKLFFTQYKVLNSFLMLFNIAILVFISFTIIGPYGVPEKSIFYSMPASFGSWFEILHRDIFSYALAYMIMACLYSADAIIKPIKSFLSLDFFYPIAQISYSAYLFHEMFMLWFYPIAVSYWKGLGLTPGTIIVVNGLISTLVILIVASLMYLFVEQPFQKLKNRRSLAVA